LGIIICQGVRFLGTLPTGMPVAIITAFPELKLQSYMQNYVRFPISIGVSLIGMSYFTNWFEFSGKIRTINPTSRHKL